MNLWKQKWLVTVIYKPPKSCGKMFLVKFSTQLNDLHTSHDIFLQDDFNMILKDLKMQDFCDIHE